MNLVVLGLSITSAWGNGHATTYRGLLGEFARRGHTVVFLERDVPWYASQRDVEALENVEIILYADLAELRGKYASTVRGADAVIVGSYVPEGIEVGDWVLALATGTTAFYDIDTPVTLGELERGGRSYLSRGQIPRYDHYLSFAGGRSLEVLSGRYGSPHAVALYCSVDPQRYFPQDAAAQWLLGYLGTYSADRQPALEQLMLEPARQLPAERFVVAGPQYPRDLGWGPNVARIEHLAPGAHAGFYNRQRFTLNVTRTDMVAAGHSPSVRLFEAAACATPIISDPWDGLDELFIPGKEILIAANTREALTILTHTSAEQAAEIGIAGRSRILAGHTAAHRAAELEAHLAAVAVAQLPFPG